METNPESSGDESDATVVLEFAGADDSGEGPIGSAEDTPNIPASMEAVEIAAVTPSEMMSSSAQHLLPSTDSDIPPPASLTPTGNDRESDVSLDIGSDAGDAVIPVLLPPVNKLANSSIAYYDTLREAEQALHGYNSVTYTYDTGYLSPFVLGKVYKCRSHVGCKYRFKL
ncbi:hypothetical protein PR003_g8595 [Phytophthora rubi]|uniref:Uncharacterized protein n=1 Tax=Phytophthora rubi TaxID=129364 RepID=A0A6A4FIH4_9STRA|nr:hypothetical protein PR002_g4794 [Phytophthora rubi]KAE9046402.1 hypothetical protein PR001_g4574 [Phytophthora rubi]KAE9344179.1 hypothetical protein PR003_g8595 [Phytophthora rubi]